MNNGIEEHTVFFIHLRVTIGVNMWIFAPAVKAVLFLQGRLWVNSWLLKTLLIEVDKRILILLQHLLAVSKTRGVGRLAYTKACLAREALTLIIRIKREEITG